MSKKLNIGIWTQLDWAFGRMFHDIQKYSKHNILLFDWSKWYPESLWMHFDLIYIPVWYAVYGFMKGCPNIPKNKIIFSVHGVSELFHRILDDNNIKTVHFSPELLNTKSVPDATIKYFSTFNKISTVSVELYDLLTKQHGLNNIILTQHGVDPDEFKVIKRDDDKFKAIYHIRHGAYTDHGYDKNRLKIIEEVDKKLKEMGSDISIIFPEKVINFRDMPKFYPQADVCLCVSHSEGGPMSPIEAGSCGLIAITTPVGSMPEFVKDKRNGYIIQSKNENDIRDEVCVRLIFLNKNRDILDKMKENMLVDIKEWHWKNKIKPWDDFFEQAYKNTL